MEKNLKFIGENNFRFKLRLAEVITRDECKNAKISEDMTVAEILTVSPKIQEWILYRLLCEGFMGIARMLQNSG